jgi:hypothetical protein
MYQYQKKGMTKALPKKISAAQRPLFAVGTALERNARVMKKPTITYRRTIKPMTE